MDKLTTHKLADGREIAFIEVPEGTNHRILDFSSIKHKAKPILFVTVGLYAWNKPLPQGNWSIIGVTDQMSEEEKSQFLESHTWANAFTDSTDEWFINYMNNKSALRLNDSFDSFIRFIGLDTTKRYCIIEKLK